VLVITCQVAIIELFSPVNVSLSILSQVIITDSPVEVIVFQVKTGVSILSIKAFSKSKKVVLILLCNCCNFVIVSLSYSQEFISESN